MYVHVVSLKYQTQSKGLYIVTLKMISSKDDLKRAYTKFTGFITVTILYMYYMQYNNNSI